LNLLASAALLRRNEISTLAGTTKILLYEPRSATESILWKLSLAIENGVKDSRGIPALSRLADAKDLRLRRAAASALRHTGSPKAIHALARSLADSDRNVRYVAVIGLAEITGQYEWGPSIDLFQREEPRYLAHWTEWAKRQ